MLNFDITPFFHSAEIEIDIGIITPGMMFHRCPIRYFNWFSKQYIKLYFSMAKLGLSTFNRWKPSKVTIIFNYC